MSSDIGKTWSEYRRQRQEKKKHNRESSTAILSRHGIRYQSHNNGTHLAVLVPDTLKEMEGIRINFWPGTGKWIIWITPLIRGRGVFQLIDQLKKFSFLVTTED